MSEPKTKRTVTLSGGPYDGKVYDHFDGAQLHLLDFVGPFPGHRAIAVYEYQSAQDHADGIVRFAGYRGNDPKDVVKARAELAKYIGEEPRLPGQLYDRFASGGPWSATSPYYWALTELVDEGLINWYRREKSGFVVYYDPKKFTPPSEQAGDASV